MKKSAKFDRLGTNISEICAIIPIDGGDDDCSIAIISGPENTPFEGGIFYLHIRIFGGATFLIPEVKFITRIYHPCVDSNGQISHDSLIRIWHPRILINNFLLGIINMLSDTICQSIPESEIQEQYLNDRARFNEVAREWTKSYAN